MTRNPMGKTEKKNGRPDRALRASGLIVCDWYGAGHRDLPWRKTRDPYRILVSEIMLQQTRVETVIGYYERFMDAFPDIASLAAASGESVMALWQGLGYYSRARNLHRAAKAILSECSGIFPKDLVALLRLPGIGPYTAGAIASIAFGRAVPAVDGNVLRVVARLLAMEEDVKKPATLRRVTALVEDMIPPRRASDFCQGMMELGAMVCVPGIPRCESCPLRNVCQAHAVGREAELPVRSAKAAPMESIQSVFLIHNPEGGILLEYRREGLLSGLWGLPHVEVEMPDEETVQARIAAVVLPEQGRLVMGEMAGSCRHVFTHRVWNMRIWHVYFLPGNIGIEFPEGYRWLHERDLKAIPIPEAFRKVLRTAGVSTGTGK